MILTSFSDWNIPLDEYPKELKGAALHKWIIKQLPTRERISCFEISEDRRMCRTLMYLVRINKLRFSKEKLSYPYTKLEVV